MQQRRILKMSIFRPYSSSGRCSARGGQRFTSTNWRETVVSGWSVSIGTLLLVTSESTAEQCSPGFGGSTPVTLNLRMRVWLETVPHLLKHVGVDNVALVTHSAGTIYTLNTLLHHRHFLDSRRPYVAFLGLYTRSIGL
jgi:hypothetical protein